MTGMEDMLQACLKKMYAVRAMRKGKISDAHALLTEALNTAGGLRTRAAW